MGRKTSKLGKRKMAGCDGVVVQGTVPQYAMAVKETLRTDSKGVMTETRTSEIGFRR